MNRSKIVVGSAIRVEEYIYIVIELYSESVLAKNIYSDHNSFIDYDDITAIV